MRKHLALAALMAIGAGGPAVAAEGFSYNLIEAGYVSNEIDSVGLDGSGFALFGSYEFNESVFGFASVTDAQYDQDSGVSTTATSVGVGFAWPLGMSVDLVSGFAYEYLRLHIDDVGSASDEGYSLNTGLRGRVGESLEITGGVKYTDLGHGADDFTLGVGGRYYFTPAFAAGIDVSDNDDGTAWMVSLRYDFGRQD
jgi:Outer membrane protein beta-barrel domain